MMVMVFSWQLSSIVGGVPYLTAFSTRLVKARFSANGRPRYTACEGKDHQHHGQGSGAGNSSRGSGARLQPFLPARKLTQSDDGWGWSRVDGSACDYPRARRRCRPVQPARRRTGSIGHAAANRLVDIAFVLALKHNAEQRIILTGEFKKNSCWVCASQTQFMERPSPWLRSASGHFETND